MIEMMNYFDSEKEHNLKLVRQDLEYNKRLGKTNTYQDLRAILSRHNLTMSDLTSSELYELEKYL